MALFLYWLVCTVFVLLTTLLVFRGFARLARMDTTPKMQTTAQKWVVCLPWVLLAPPLFLGAFWSGRQLHTWLYSAGVFAAGQTEVGAALMGFALILPAAYTAFFVMVGIYLAIWGKTDDMIPKEKYTAEKKRLAQDPTYRKRYRILYRLTGLIYWAGDAVYTKPKKQRKAERTLYGIFTGLYFVSASLLCVGIAL